MKFSSKFIHFHSRKSIWNFHEIAAILSRPQCFKMWQSDSRQFSYECSIPLLSDDNTLWTLGPVDALWRHSPLQEDHGRVYIRSTPYKEPHWHQESSWCQLWRHWLERFLYQGDTEGIMRRSWGGYPFRVTGISWGDSTRHPYGTSIGYSC